MRASRRAIGAGDVTASHANHQAPAAGLEDADNEGLTPGQRRKLSLELAGKGAASAETGAWTELLRMYARDLLSREVDARGDGTRTTHHTESRHDARFRQDGLVQHLGSFTDTADQRAHRITSKPLLRYTRWLLLRQMNTRLRGSKCSAQLSSKPQRTSRPSEAGEAKRGPSGWRNADIAAIGRSEAAPAVQRDWTGT